MLRLSDYLLYHIRFVCSWKFLFMLSASNKLLSHFQIATVTGELRYMDAMRLLYTVEDASKGLGIHELSSLLA